jgi:hypothetical protein
MVNEGAQAIGGQARPLEPGRPLWKMPWKIPWEKPGIDQDQGSTIGMVNRSTGSTVALHVRSVITAETTREGYVYEPQFLPTEDPSEP